MFIDLDGNWEIYNIKSNTSPLNNAVSEVQNGNCPKLNICFLLIIHDNIIF